MTENIILLQTPAVAILTVDFYLIEYSNPTSADCDDLCFFNCNNRFEFYIRKVGDKGNFIQRIISNVYANDFIKFKSSYHSQLKISNPLHFLIPGSVSDII